MDYSGQNDDYRHRNRQRSSPYSKEDSRYSNQYDDGDRSSHKNRNYKRSRSRSPVRSNSRSKSRQFYDSTSRNHHSSNPSHFNKYDSSLEGDKSSTGGGGYGSHNNNNFFERNKGDVGSESKMGRSFNPGTPSRTVMLRQLPLELEDADIRTEFNMQSLPYKNIRLVKNRDTGQSRGFAFVEFGSVDEAQRWMASTQGWYLFRNHDTKVQMFFSSTKEDMDAGMVSDWVCTKCGIKNFKRRDHCFKCNISREDSDNKLNGDGYEHTSNALNDTLTLRGLDTNTTEETLLSMVNTRTNFCLTVKNCYIVRDPFTNVSRGFAFIEANSTTEAVSLLDILNPDFEVDGKLIDVTFSRNSFKTAKIQLNIENRLDYDPQFSHSNSSNQTSNPFIAQANPKNPRANQADQVNSAAAVAQKAMQNMQKKQEFISHITSQLKQEEAPVSSIYAGKPNYPKSSHFESTIASNLTQLAKQATQVYAPPDPSKFVYDETSGFYYDYSTRFYYDAKSQYYFNSDLQQYMYWDSVQSTYKPVERQQETVVTESEVEKIPEPVAISDEKVKHAPVKTAAQIAKDMERWAKSQNTKSKSTSVPKYQKPIIKAIPATFITAEVNAIPDAAGIKEMEPIIPETIQLEKEIEQVECIAEPLKPVDVESTENVLVNSPPPEQPPPPSFIDTIKMACLLCKRQFDSIEILKKHVNKSDLHKKNLEKYKQENASESHDEEKEGEEEPKNDSDSLMAAFQYRDRASERRIKYGQSETVPQAKKAKRREKTKDIQNEEILQATAAKVALSTNILDNTESVASKLMRKMGWNEGSGIGKNMQGISAPIQATLRSKGAGLGASGSFDMDPNDTYSDAVRKSARARYESLQ